MALPLPSNPAKAAPSAGISNPLEDLFGPRTRTVPNLESKGRVPAPRAQQLIEMFRTDPAGTRELVANAPIEVKQNLLTEIVNEFPPARPDQKVAPTGQRLIEYLFGKRELDPQEAAILAEDAAEGMRGGTVGEVESTFALGDGGGDAVVNPVDVPGTTLGPGEASRSADAPPDTTMTGGQTPAPPDQPVNPNRGAAWTQKNEELGWVSPRRDRPPLRANSREAVVLDPETGDAASIVSKKDGVHSRSSYIQGTEAGQRKAAAAIEGNRGLSGKEMGTVNADNTTAAESIDQLFNGMMNNSKNPDALSSNKIQELLGLIGGPEARATDLRPLFGSIDEATDHLMGFADAKMLDSMVNPDVIGGNMNASVRQKEIRKGLREIVRKQVAQLYPENSGWGKSIDELGTPSTGITDGSVSMGDSMDGVRGAKLNDGTDFRTDGNRQPDRIENELANQQERFDIYAEELKRLTDAGMTEEEALSEMARNGMDTDFLTAGENSYRNTQIYGDKPSNTVEAQQQNWQNAKKGADNNAKNAPDPKPETPKTDTPDETPKTDEGDLDNSNGSGAENLGRDGLDSPDVPDSPTKPNESTSNTPGTDGNGVVDATKGDAKKGDAKKGGVLTGPDGKRTLAGKVWTGTKWLAGAGAVALGYNTLMNGEMKQRYPDSDPRGSAAGNNGDLPVGANPDPTGGRKGAMTDEDRDALLQRLLQATRKTPSRVNRFTGTNKNWVQ